MNPNLNKSHIDTLLAEGKYAVVNFAHPVFFCTVVSIKTFLNVMKHTIKAIRASIPSNSKGQVAVQIKGEILVMQVVDHSEAPGGDLFSQTESDESSAETSARAAQSTAEIKAEAARQASSKFVNAAQELASDAETHPRTLEDINAVIALNDDPTALRSAYVAALQPEVTLDFIEHQQILGGHGSAPAGFVSKETFVLHNCRLTINNTQLSVTAPNHDANWQRIQKSFGKTTPLRAHNTDIMRRLRIAAALDVQVSLEVSVFELTGKRKRYLTPLRILNESEIVESCKQELELLSSS
ncbi:hypothetical protein OTERR_30540 [Oryzomicrobium terrae]|uniref:Uncharacterized protein n=1 Tax=Oryzomicrobium terrae TaxID=1735038 RepID=A0A5C1EC76_9RHOO|nr:hypothetical protein [Oryzomicrobium terrae]QEL66530.1 hypothetical protein OTERR_30540 [Oryzomicrobium terrae]